MDMEYFLNIMIEKLDFAKLNSIFITEDNPSEENNNK